VTASFSFEHQIMKSWPWRIFITLMKLLQARESIYKSLKYFAAGMFLQLSKTLLPIFLECKMCLGQVNTLAYRQWWGEPEKRHSALLKIEFWRKLILKSSRCLSQAKYYSRSDFLNFNIGHNPS
jgi:hypothetical protein